MQQLGRLRAARRLSCLKFESIYDGNGRSTRSHLKGVAEIRAEPGRHVGTTEIGP
jgi:hypothetical protein